MTRKCDQKNRTKPWSGLRAVLTSVVPFGAILVRFRQIRIGVLALFAMSRCAIGVCDPSLNSSSVNLPSGSRDFPVLSALSVILPPCFFDSLITVLVVDSTPDC